MRISRYRNDRMAALWRHVTYRLTTATPHRKYKSRQREISYVVLITCNGSGSTEHVYRQIAAEGINRFLLNRLFKEDMLTPQI